MTFEEWWEAEIGKTLTEQAKTEAKLSLIYKAMERAYEAGYDNGYDSGHYAGYDLCSYHTYVDQ